jgi:RNA polymerase sigma factor (sigma-70 family)
MTDQPGTADGLTAPEHIPVGGEEFVRQHRDKLVKAVTAWTGDRWLAEDVCQEVMVELVRRLDRYDRPDLLMYTMARQALHRRRRRAAARLESVGIVPTFDGVERADSICDVEERVDLMALVLRLPRRQREVVVLKVVCDLGFADIAEILGISTSAVKTHHERALANIEKYLRGDKQILGPRPRPAGGGTNEP